MEDERQLLERALGYPYAAPPRSFALVGKRVVGLEEVEVDLSARIAVLAYGSNASPEVLARKLGASEEPAPVHRAELHDFDVVYSAHVSPYGAVPATLRPSLGTEVAVFVAHLTGEQLELLAPTEPNYSLERLTGIDLFPEGRDRLDEALAYLSRHGPCGSAARKSPSPRSPRAAAVWTRWGSVRFWSVCATRTGPAKRWSGSCSAAPRGRSACRFP